MAIQIVAVLNMLFSTFADLPSLSFSVDVPLQLRALANA